MGINHNIPGFQPEIEAPQEALSSVECAMLITNRTPPPNGFKLNFRSFFPGIKFSNAKVNLEQWS